MWVGGRVGGAKFKIEIATKRRMGWGLDSSVARTTHYLGRVHKKKKEKRE